MKKILILISVIVLQSCYKTPQSTDARGNGFQVEFLFEHDGIKLYRFWDGGEYHYFSNKGETISQKYHGKIKVDENIY
jgi:hypothetical protein